MLIAEIGCNHMGDMELAFKMIDTAADICHVPRVKFQKRDSRTLLSEEQYNSPHPVAANSFGATYGAHREFLEFDEDQHRELIEYCERKGIDYSCSVWDLPSLEVMIRLAPGSLKVPSATNTNLELIRSTCERYDGEIHISLGMTTREEEDQLLAVLRSSGRMNSTVLYACTSGYPIEASQAHLLEIVRLREMYGDELLGVGFSGHHKGISLDIAAATLGATYIERHFTLDRTWKGTDHAASLEPDGLRRLQRDLYHLSEALTLRPMDIVPIEEPQRAKLKWQSGVGNS